MQMSNYICELQFTHRYYVCVAILYSVYRNEKKNTPIIGCAGLAKINNAQLYTIHQLTFTFLNSNKRFVQSGSKSFIKYLYLQNMGIVHTSVVKYIEDYL